MMAKMRKVMYLVETPNGIWPTYSYKAATSDGNKIINVILVPIDDLTDEPREVREARMKYREKVWAKFHNKPRA